MPSLWEPATNFMQPVCGVAGTRGVHAFTTLPGPKAAMRWAAGAVLGEPSAARPASWYRGNNLITR